MLFFERFILHPLSLSLLPKILLGDTATLLAVRALTHVALGRGVDIPADIVSH